jgi:hypothetical protein
MRKSARYVAVLVLLAAMAAGCDSQEERTDAERLAGNWNVSHIIINGENFTQQLLAVAGVDGVEGRFETNGNFTLTTVRGTERTDLSGTYTINESTKTIVLSSPDFSAPVTLTYSVSSGGEFAFSSNNAALLAELSGIDLEALGLQVNSLEIRLRRG